MTTDKTYRIIISGGGTGGHVFPAIAIANALKKREPATKVLFVGAKDKMEMEKVPAAGYPIEGLWISGFNRKMSLSNLSFPFKVIASMFKSWRILSRFKPDAAVGVGGYASGPLVWTAATRGIPTLIQEQNSYAGITNKVLSKKVDKICVAYANTDRFFPKEKMVITGNPLRAGITKPEVGKNEALRHFGLKPGLKTLFVTGGSLGARGINEGIFANLKKFEANNIQVLWQTGKIYFDEFTQRLGNKHPNVKLLAFIDRMDMAFAAADVIVSRAGGIISELCIIGKPVVLMPSPNVAEDHQTANAMSLVNENAALMVRDNEAADKLYDAVAELFDENKAAQMSQNIKKLAKPNAANDIANEIIKLIKHNK